MPISMKNIRRLQDIRTLEGSVDLANQPYRAFMKITCLEMEKARRAKERESALHRVKNIDERLEEIEIEKANLMKVLGMSDDKAIGPASRTVALKGPEGFRLRY